MKQRQHRCRGMAAAGPLLACAALLGAGAGGARAEFKAGSEVPAFSLSTPDGQTVSLDRADGKLQVTQDGQTQQPPVVAIHLLQPDCMQCRAQLRALQPVHERFAERGLVTLGIAHRGDEKQLGELGRDLRLTFPLLSGGGSEIAAQFAAGDTLGLVDRSGVIRFAQVGYGAGDEALWVEAIESMLGGNEPAKAGVDRERLAVGDSFPAVILPDLRTGKPMELGARGDRLVFRDQTGTETPIAGAVGFFSRY